MKFLRDYLPLLVNVYSLILSIHSPFPRHFPPSSLYSLKYPSREVSPLNPCPYVNHELPSRRLREGTWQDSPQEERAE